VALKINVKLGGLNVVPNKLPFLNDPANPTIIMGADAIHPPPGSQGRPSFVAVVGSVDTTASHYVSACGPQKSGKEIIDGIEAMTKSIITKHIAYKTKVEQKPDAQAKPKVNPYSVPAITCNHDCTSLSDLSCSVMVLARDNSKSS